MTINNKIINTDNSRRDPLNTKDEEIVLDSGGVTGRRGGVTGHPGSGPHIRKW